MTQDLLIAWSQTEAAPDDGAEIAVHSDGRVELSPRLGGGEHRLDPDDLEELKRFVFDEAGFLSIQQAALDREVSERAAAARAERTTEAAAYVTEPDRDAGVTRLWCDAPGGRHLLAHRDLAGDAGRYPEADVLQRLRRIELRLLDLAERLGGPGG